jgi:hypothetical protein
MHPDGLRALVSQHTRDLREEVGGRRRSRGAGWPKVRTLSSTGGQQIFVVSRAADPSPVSSNLPALAVAPEPTPMGIPITSTATVQIRHHKIQRNAS